MLVAKLLIMAVLFGVVLRTGAVDIDSKLQALELESKKVTSRAHDAITRLQIEARFQTERFVAGVKEVTGKVNALRDDVQVKLRRIGQIGLKAGEISAIERRMSGDGSGMESHLARYGLPATVAADVVQLSNQQIPRDLIVNQLQRKYPTIEVHEVNDIIVSAHAHLGRPVPHLNDMRDAERLNDVRAAEKIAANNNKAPKRWFKAAS
jgi:hypothetical protein